MKQTVHPFRTVSRVIRTALLAASMALAACGGGALPAATVIPPASTRAPLATSAMPGVSRPITLTASTALLADMARNLTSGIQGVTVNAVVPLGTDPHEFEPTPADARLIAGSAALIVVGVGYEAAWLDRLLKNAGGRQRVIEAGAGIELAGAEHGDGKDPHIWMDPQRWSQAAVNVAKVIAALDPAVSATVDANATAYSARLAELDAWVKAETSRLAPDQRVLVTSHDAFGYYADRYGFKVVGAVLPSSADGAPSARQVKTLVDQIKASRVRAIFLEVGLNPSLTEAVANEAGVQVVERLYVDTLSDAAGPAPTYIDLIRHNTKTIVDALR